MIVMLDIDGVLNGHRFDTERRRQARAGEMVDPHRIDRACVARLQRVLDATGAKVVVTSEWRVWHPSVASLDELLSTYGLAPRSVIGLTPVSGKPRGELIEAWMDTHPGNWPFLAIDDTPVLVGFSRPGAAPNELPIELLVTDPEVGLTDADVEEAIRRLRKMAGEEPP